MCDQNQIRLLSSALKGHYLHTSISDGQSRHEANLSAGEEKSAAGGTAMAGTNQWTINLFKKFRSDEEEYMQLAQPISLFHSEAEAYITATTNSHKVQYSHRV